MYLTFFFTHFLCELLEAGVKCEEALLKSLITSVCEMRKLLSAELKTGAGLCVADTDTGPSVNSVQQTGSQKDTLLYQTETVETTMESLTV